MAKQMHAILIEGGTQARRLSRAMTLLKDHFADDPEAALRLDKGVFEDLVVLEPAAGKKELGVEQIRELVESFKQKPFASTGKACLIPNGERMATGNNKEEVQNTFLKLLEEPLPGDIIIILIANAEMLKPTIRSRCVRIWLGYEEAMSGPFTDDLRGLISALIYRKEGLAEAWQILSRYEGSREEAIGFLEAFQLFLRNISVARLASGLITDDSEEGRRLKEASAKVLQKHADRMQGGVMLVEKAMRRIEKGDRVSKTLRGMALAMRSY
jgi:hypothetical protein